MVLSFANKTALTRHQSRNSKRVLFEGLLGGSSGVIRIWFLALEFVQLLLRLRRVFGWGWLWFGEQLRVCFFVLLASESLSLAHHLAKLGTGGGWFRL